MRIKSMVIMLVILILLSCGKDPKPDKSVINNAFNTDTIEMLKPESIQTNQTENIKTTISNIHDSERWIEDILEDYKSCNQEFLAVPTESIPRDIVSLWKKSVYDNCDYDKEYFASSFDLNDDGIKEIMLGNWGSCGSGGCFDTYIYQNIDNSWKRISTEITDISQSKTNGYFDTYDWIKCYHNDGGFYCQIVRFRWNGNNYERYDSMYEQGCISDEEFGKIAGKKYNRLTVSDNGYEWKIFEYKYRVKLCKELAEIYSNNSWEFYLELLDEFYDSNDTIILSQEILFVVRSAIHLTSKEDQFNDIKDDDKADSYALKVYNYMQDRWDFYESLDGGYYPDIHDETVLSETAEKFNISTQEALNIFRKIEEGRYGL